MKQSCVLFLLIISAFSFANTPTAAHITVTGHASKTFTPERAEVFFSLRQEASTSQNAVANIKAKYGTVLTQLTRLGLSEKHIHAPDIKLHPHYHYDDNRNPKLKGMQAVRDIKVTLTDLKTLNSLVDALSHIAGLQITRTQYDVNERDTKLKALLQKAIQDAKDKAKAYAEGFDVTLGPLYFTGKVHSQNMPMHSMRTMAESQSHGFQHQDIVLSQSVNATFLIAQD